MPQRPCTAVLPCTYKLPSSDKLTFNGICSLPAGGFLHTLLCLRGSGGPGAAQEQPARMAAGGGLGPKAVDPTSGWTGLAGFPQTGQQETKALAVVAWMPHTEHLVLMV